MDSGFLRNEREREREREKLKEGGRKREGKWEGCYMSVRHKEREKDDVKELILPVVILR